MLRAFGFLISLFFFGCFVAIAAVMGVLWSYGKDLPDYSHLANYKPVVMSRVHAANGTAVAEFATERRLFVPITAIPQIIIDAVLSAEDKTFYEHPGIDIWGIGNAVYINLKNIMGERRPVGASTITQQVAKNFLLSNEVSIDRKIKEAILAFRLEHAYSKDYILELYLNRIYLGQGSYGVAAASLNYFNKSLNELTLEEAAYLAALPKAPNNYHPVFKTEAAERRRNWVLDRMTEDGKIPADSAETAKQIPLKTTPSDAIQFAGAEYYAEEVRRLLASDYGDDGLYGGGLSVRTTLDSDLQRIGRQTLRQGLIDFDRRNGWRGPAAIVAPDPEADYDARWRKTAAELENSLQIDFLRVALVRELSDKKAIVERLDGRTGEILLEDVTWARTPADLSEPKSTKGPKIEKVTDVLHVGDLVWTREWEDPEKSAAETDETGNADTGQSDASPLRFTLQQVPEVNGALLALDPHTGRILAMVGGFSHAASEFNRATQARRQPGSAFKPFVYAAALDSGFSPSSLVLDAPFVIEQGDGLGRWKPSNYTKKFYGPSTLRLGIEKSRNLMTVRLAQEIGMPVIVDYAGRFGIDDRMPPLLTMALGAGETTLLRLTTAYAMLVNGGKVITPTMIDRIQDRNGLTIAKHDKRDCPGCTNVPWEGQPEPVIEDPRAAVVTPETAFQIVSMLEGVVQRGTGRRISAVGKPLAGKTGTTNEARDTWFVGFSPDLAVGVFVGYDTPKSLGRKQSGTTVAAPIFRDFMAEALAGKPAIPFRIPNGITLVRVNSKTGAKAEPGEKRVILEAFQRGQRPNDGSVIVLDGSQAAVETGTTTRAGTGGLY